MDAVTALDVLQRASEDGRLEALARRHSLRLVVAFGSAARDEPGPRDLDVAVLADGKVDLVAVYEALAQLTRYERIDLVDLRRAGTVVRARALGACVPLYEDEPGLFAEQQMFALTQFADTAWLREAQLRALAS
jgi:predicted nucleotidyltransferase